MFFENVLTNLNNQIEYFSKVSELCSEEKQSILDGDADAVSAIVEELKQLYSKANKEENARIELIKNSKQFSGKEDVALDDIINICTDAKMKEKITAAKERLVKAIKKQKELNDTISQLLKSNLDYCDYMITAFSSEVTPNNFYSSDGSEVGSGRSAIRIIDSEV